MLKVANETCKIASKGNPIWLTTDFSAETLQTKRDWGPVFTLLKEKQNKETAS